MERSRPVPVGVDHRLPLVLCILFAFIATFFVFSILTTLRAQHRAVVQLVPDTRPLIAREVPTPAVAQGTAALAIPKGMQFTASTRGKYYYPVQSGSAQRLSPKNRVYFSSEAQAQAAGYLLGR